MIFVYFEFIIIAKINRKNYGNKNKSRFVKVDFR